jgi:hypothetical protein
MKKRKASNGAPLKWIHDHVAYIGDGCLIWPFSRLEKGYPAVVWPLKGAKVGILACRFMCELVHGPAPQGDYDAAHSCGNGMGGCIHPQHLDWKTRQQNADDRRVHGTNTVGSRHPMAKLDEEKVRAIRRSKSDLESLAIMFGVSIAAISLARSGKTWGHVR